MTLPKGTWDRFWNHQKIKPASQISWSKRRILSILSPYLKEGQWALDAGCGSGFFSKFFCDAGMRTISCDYSKEALRLTQDATQGRSDLLSADLLTQELGAVVREKCSIVFTDGLLEHFSFEDQNKILKNLASILADHGALITFVPNRWSPWELIRPFYMPGINEQPFVLSELTALLQGIDLAIIAKGGINTFPFRFSPDAFLGDCFGMLLYAVAKKKL